MTDMHISAQPEQDTRRKFYEISEIAHLIKKFIESEQTFQGVWLKGETSRITYHSSGHLYFSLKDDKAVINAVMWKSSVSKLSFKIQEGISVLVLGNITTYPARGNYQLQALDIIPEGIGRLQQAIEELKLRLHQQGLFAPERKKPLPFLPSRVGIVSSPTGAAVRDVIRVLRSRYHNLDILIIPCQVQGEEAAQTIVAAIEEGNQQQWQLDLMILCRGGGSLEDLMAYNHEKVVYAIANSEIPIVTGIGHEIDISLADHVADKRAATPSQAAEFAVPEVLPLMDGLEDSKQRLKKRMQKMLVDNYQQLDRLSSSRMLQRPANYINELLQKIDDLSDQCRKNQQRQLERLSNRLNRYDSLPEKMSRQMDQKIKEFALMLEKLQGLSPLRALSRGYAYVRDENKRIIKHGDQVNPGSKISVRIIDSSLECRIETIQKEPSISTINLIQD